MNLSTYFINLFCLFDLISHTLVAHEISLHFVGALWWSERREHTQKNTFLLLQCWIHSVLASAVAAKLKCRRVALQQRQKCIPLANVSMCACACVWVSVQVAVYVCVHTRTHVQMYAQSTRHAALRWSWKLSWANQHTHHTRNFEQNRSLCHCCCCCYTIGIRYMTSIFVLVVWLRHDGDAFDTQLLSKVDSNTNTNFAQLAELRKEKASTVSIPFLLRHTNWVANSTKSVNLHDKSSFDSNELQMMNFGNNKIICNSLFKLSNFLLVFSCMISVHDNNCIYMDWRLKNKNRTENVDNSIFLEKIQFWFSI